MRRLSVLTSRRCWKRKATRSSRKWATVRSRWSGSRPCGRHEVRRLLGRAKGLLQSEHGMTEPQAFRWIQKTSMDRRLTMRKVAEAVIEGTLSATAKSEKTEEQPE